MSKIIQFPKQKKPPVLHNKELKAVLEKLAPELRQRIEMVLTDISDEYAEVYDGISLQFPSEATAEQINSVRTVIERQQTLIGQLMTQLSEEKIKHEISKFNNS